MNAKRTKGEKTPKSERKPGKVKGKVKNATKIGPAFGPAAEVALAVAVAKGKAGELDTMVELSLDGEDAIVGRTLVVHADKKGKPGAVVACGPIVLDADDADDDEE